jgi:hypothetical protein
LWPADTHVNYDANVNTTVNKLRQALGESTINLLYRDYPAQRFSFISSAEFSEVPFPLPLNLPSASGALGATGSSEEHPAGTPKPTRWLTLIIVALILAGMLLGAGAATYWISHFAPQLRHSASKAAVCDAAGHNC